ncbi:zinc-activated ligand-gated ion channel-like [Esox lucius]|nr:zinc-activated ligand-gated ion channel-like [Esox lucius]
MLIEKEALSQPQSPQCTSIIHVPLIVYKTLSVDTKKLLFKSCLQVMMSWEDPDLSWDTSVYQYDTVVLPVRKIWTPDLHVANGVQTNTTHGNQDLLVHSNGTIEHSVIMNTLVQCQVNLYKYPFTSDDCAIAINAWALNGCGMQLKFGNVNITTADSGDWLTEAVELNAQGERNDRNYLLVSLKMRSENQFLSLVLPSILITLADVVSYALPLGNRIGFKVKLMLSFVMFLNLLSNFLPGGGQCSPIIECHFAFCLIILVLSTLQSMVVTRLAKCGTLLPGSLSKSKHTNLKDNGENGDEEPETNISVIEMKDSKKRKNKPLQKLLKLLKNISAEDDKAARNHCFANKVDMICLCIYLIILIVYTAVMAYYYFGSPCKIDPLGFWN